MKHSIHWLIVFSAAALVASACSKDAAQSNPNFHASAGSSASSEAGAPDELGGAPGSAGSGQAGSSTPETAGAPANGGTFGSSGAAGEGGAPPEVPPYDCVLHPKTHLEIINACTDATRIEKHPNLPAPH